MEKIKALRKLTREQLVHKEEEEKAMLHKLLGVHTIAPLENPMRIRKTRKKIARIKTLLNEQDKK